MKKSIFVLLLILSCVADAAGWTGAKTVSAIYPLANGDVVVQHPSGSASECSQANGKYYVIKSSTEASMRLYALIMMAYKENKAINLNLSQCTAEGYSEIAMALMGNLR